MLLSSCFFWSFLRVTTTPPNSRVDGHPSTTVARFDLVPPFELPFEGPSMDPIILEPGPVDPHAMEDEDLIVDASNMNFMHVPAEAGLRAAASRHACGSREGIHTVGCLVWFLWDGATGCGWER